MQLLWEPTPARSAKILASPPSPRCSTTTTCPRTISCPSWVLRPRQPKTLPKQSRKIRPLQADSKDAKPGEKAGEAKPGDDKNKPTEQAAKEAAWKQWGDRLTQQQSQIDLNTRELDVLQREYQIRAAAMYADVGNRLRNSTDWDKQDAQYKQQIADKQKALDDAKQKLDDMQEEARKAGVPASVREQ